MKTKFNPILRKSAVSALAALVLAAVSAHATPYYWDTDGATPGFGNTAGTWGTNTFWSTDITGASATANTPITTTDGVNFGTASLALGSTASTVGIVAGGVTANSITFGAGQTTAVTLSSGGGTITLGGTTPTITVDNSADTINSVIAAAAGVLVTKTGNGTLTLGGANTFNNFSITAGTVKIATTSLAVGLNGGQIAISSGAILDLNGIGGGSQTAYNGLGEIRNTSSTSVVLNVGNTSGSFSGNINQNSTGLISIAKQSGGTQAFLGTNNATGTITVNNGALTLNQILDSAVGNISLNGAANSLLTYSGSTNATASGRSVAISGGASGSGIIDSSGTGTLTLGAASLSAAGAKTLVLRGSNTGANTMGNITNGSDVLSLTKDGTGTWALSGSNSYTGITTVSTGTLLINGDQNAATGAVNVAAGATLGGNGTIGGATSLATTAKLDSIGSTLSFTKDAANALNLSGITGGGNLLFDLSTNDKVTLTSTTANALNVGTLDFADFTFSGAAVGNYTLFDANSAILGSIGTASGDLGGGLTGTLSFGGTNDVLFSVVPEPSTWALLAFSLTTVMVLRRRRMA